MAEDILSKEINPESNLNEDELFIRVENNLLDSEKIDAPAYSYWRSVFRCFFKNPVNIVALIMLFIIIILAYVQPLFSGYERMNGVSLGNPMLLSPFSTYTVEQVIDGEVVIKNVFFLFGTDANRDNFFDFIWKGTQFSLTLAFIVTAIDMVLGILAGALWGYSKLCDKIFTEIYNIVANVPSLVVTIIILYALGNSFWNIVLALTCTAWLGIGYSFRTQVIIIRDRDYNLASRCLGTSTFRMITHNILPFLVSIIVTYISNYLPSCIGSEVFLSYIGLGFNQYTASLGSAINEGVGYISRAENYIFWIPVIVSAIVTITLYVAGQGLADASDPRNHR